MSELNMLSYLISNENDTTKLLYALLNYKPFRDTLIRLFTDNHFEADKISWDDVYTQCSIGGCIPDLSIQSQKVSILIEIKTSLYCGLTDNQPESYLTWLSGNCAVGDKFFVIIIPPGYYYLNELKTRIKKFQESKKENPVTSIILTWDKVLSAIHENDLNKMNPYIQDFYNLLNSMYQSPIINFTFEEVRSMYDKNTAKAIGKLFKITDSILKELEQKGYQIEYSLNKKWWDNGEYGGYIKCENQYVLWFGIWQSYWEDSGVPLCFGIDKNWNAQIIHEFKRLYPNSIEYPSKNPYILGGVEKDILMSDDAVVKILDFLERYLINLCNQLIKPENI
jgi:hypothetical protein